MSSIELSPREQVLAAVAVVGFGAVARALSERLLAYDDATLARFDGVVAPSLIAILGAPETLPWVDGVIYLGRDPRAPRLLVPTSLQPTIGIELFERAIVRHAASASPLAITFSPRRVFSVAAALPIERARLVAWLASS